MSESFADISLHNIINSYLYNEYFNDDDLQAFITAYNGLSQKAYNFFNIYPTLADYTNPNMVGVFLDWCATGIYGIPRPVLSSGFISLIGPYATYAYGELPYSILEETGTVVYETVTDEIYRRILTWNLFKGDGKTFSVRWLKRRVAQFLGGAGGIPINTANTQQISVEFANPKEIIISIGAGLYPLTYLPELIAGVEGGALQLPFQYTFVVG